MRPATDDATTHVVETTLQAFNQASEIHYEKVSLKGKRKVRVIDVKQHVVEPITGQLQDGRVMLRVGIYQTSEGAIKPSQVWDVLGTQFHLPIDTDMMLARRVGIYHRDEQGSNQSLFEQ